ncbi:MAG: hypothetical protein IJ507_04060 [Clostridia bacterium]|nr:hypothetical protein [Clostridia bacterium]
MKFAFIGQDIPTLLPTLLTDMLFAGRQAADVAVEERNPAMQDVLERYGRAIYAKADLGGEFTVTGRRAEALAGADCVIYAGDCMAVTRFHQDREALSGVDEDDPGLSDQARVNGGIGGLMHTLRQGENVLTLCEEMQERCPGALVISLGQPVARTTAMFENMGFRCFGLGRTPLRGANGLDAVCKKLKHKIEKVDAQIAGLPGFAFLLSMEEAGKDLLPRVEKLTREGEFGRLSKRWLDWYGAVAVGDVTDHAEWLPAQPDFIPEEDPELGESIEKRKERILYMNTVGDKGAADREGMMAQLLLLSKAPPIRPMQLALALLRGEDLRMPAVARRNNGALRQLTKDAIIEAELLLKGGEVQPQGLMLPGALAEICADIDETNRLAARAAAGDRGALRECIDLDPALEGLDRLYCQELVDKLIEMHSDVIERL